MLGRLCGFCFFLCGTAQQQFWALVLTLLIELFLHYEDKIEDLEKRIALLEGKASAEEGPAGSGEGNHETADIDGQPHRN